METNRKPLETKQVNFSPMALKLFLVDVFKSNENRPRITMLDIMLSFNLHKCLEPLYKLRRRNFRLFKQVALMF